MTATVEASYTTVQGDGGGDGKTITTGTEVDAGDWLITAVMSSSNADAISAPSTGTWVEITLPDNVVLTAGGQIRVYKCPNPADSTAYTHTLSGGRRTLIGALIGGADATNCVDVASSLESAAGTNHAPPSVTPSGANYLVLDFAFHRQFSPDTSNWTVPAAGLTWTEVKDVQGADGNNNVRAALGTAVAGTAGVAISTSPWTTTDTNEESMVVRIVIKSAAGGQSAAVGTVTETNTAQALGRAKTRAVGTAAETSTAVALGRAKKRSVGSAAETDLAATLARAKTRAIGGAAETSIAAALGRGKARSVGLAATVEAALPILRAGSSITVGAAGETDTARPLGRGKSRAIGTATATETALQIVAAGGVTFRPGGLLVAGGRAAATLTAGGRTNILEAS